MNAKATRPEGVDAATRIELEKFLATAPPQLTAWAQAQLAALDAPTSRDKGEEESSASARSTLTDSESVRAADRTAKKATAKPWWRHPLLVAAVIAGVVFGVWFIGKPAPEQSPAAQPPPLGANTNAPAQLPISVDQTKAAELEAHVAANPQDLEALHELAFLYFGGGDFPQATRWFNVIIATDPSDLDCRLTLGVSHYNVGNLTEAEAAWQEVLTLDPANVEAYYNLGFLYLSQDPPNQAAADEAWGKVLELAPDSELARTITTHADGLGMGG